MDVQQENALDEAELLARCLKQDRAAFGVLVERYAGPIFNVVSRMVEHEAAAHELAQGIFISAFHALPTLRAESRFSTWLYRVAINHCHDWLRSRQAGQRTADGDLDAEGGPHDAHGSRIAHEQLSERLDQAIQRLPPLYREAFILKHVEGLTYEEISEILNVRRDTLKMRVYKARTRLCEDLVELREYG